MADNSYPLYQPSKLDENQILKGAYDEDAQRLRTDAIAYVSNVSIAVDLDPTEDGVFVADRVNGNELIINDDGSINVVNSTGIVGTSRNIFNEILSIASGATTNLVTYTVPAAKSALLDRIFVSGENIAKYDVFINGSKIDCGRTYFGSSLNICFNYESENLGFKLAANDILLVQVTHNRPSTANFEGRIQLTEVD